MRTRGIQHRSAFTLIEMTMVVLVLGIASALAIPLFSQNDDVRCQAAARTLLADLHFAQNRAIALHKSQYILFSGQQYSLSDQTNLQPMDHPLNTVSDGGKYIMTFGVGGSPSLSGCSIGTITIEGTPAASGTTDILGFNDLGAPFVFKGTSETPLSEAATIIVQSGGVSMSIQIEPVTGDVTIE